MKKLNKKIKRGTLTKLKNREALKTDTLKIIEGDIDLTAVFIDLGNFKVVNDCLGHSAVDAYLAEF